MAGSGRAHFTYCAAGNHRRRAAYCRLSTHSRRAMHRAPSVCLSAPLVDVDGVTSAAPPGPWPRPPRSTANLGPRSCALALAGRRPCTHDKKLWSERAELSLRGVRRSVIRRWPRGGVGTRRRAPGSWGGGGLRVVGSEGVHSRVTLRGARGPDGMRDATSVRKLGEASGRKGGLSGPRWRAMK